MWTQLCPGRSWAPGCPSGGHHPLEHYRTYSFLFSSVTGTFRPLGFSSCWRILPKALCSTQKVWSSTGVISFSLSELGQKMEVRPLPQHSREQNMSGEDPGDRQTELTACHPRATGGAAAGRHRACASAGVRVLGGAGGTPAPRPCAPDPRLPPSQEGDGSPTIL